MFSRGLPSSDDANSVLATNEIVFVHSRGYRCPGYGTRHCFQREHASKPLPAQYAEKALHVNAAGLVPMKFKVKVPVARTSQLCAVSPTVPGAPVTLLSLLVLVAVMIRWLHLPSGGLDPDARRGLDLYERGYCETYCDGEAGLSDRQRRICKRSAIVLGQFLWGGFGTWGMRAGAAQVPQWIDAPMTDSRYRGGFEFRMETSMLPWKSCTNVNNRAWISVPFRVSVKSWPTHARQSAMCAHVSRFQRPLCT